MEWTIQDLGAIGEFVGAILVAFTLGYLAVQIRVSRKATIADIYQNRAATRAEANLRIAFNNPEFHKIMYKLESKRRDGWASAAAALTEEEQYYVSQWHTALLVRFDNLYFQYKQGLLPSDYFEDIKKGIANFLPLWKSLRLQEDPLLRPTTALSELIAQIESPVNEES